MGAAHVPLLCNNVPPAACSCGSVPAGGFGRVVQVVTVEGCWDAAALASLPSCSDTAGGVAGDDAGEGAEGMLLVVMRRVLGSISLVRSRGFRDEPVASRFDGPSPAHVWREITDKSEGRPREERGGDGGLGPVGVGGSGGMIPLPGGLWVRVEVGRAATTSAHSSDGTVCQMSESGSCLRVIVAQEDGPGVVESDGQMICSVVNEVQRVADGVAASLSLKSGRLLWVLA